MSVEQEQFQNQSSGVLKGVLIGSSMPFIFGALILLYELLAPADLSLFKMVGQKLGMMKASVIQEQAPSEAMHEMLLSFAQQEEERRTIREKEFQEMKKILLATSAQMEQQAAQAQAALVQSSMAGQQLIVNVADVACQVSPLFPEYARQLKQGCVVANVQRQAIASTMKNTLEKNQVEYTNKSLQNLPKAQDFGHGGLTFLQMLEMLKALKNE